jgi:hypothetical protein
MSWREPAIGMPQQSDAEWRKIDNLAVAPRMTAFSLMRRLVGGVMKVSLGA